VVGGQGFLRNPVEVCLVGRAVRIFLFVVAILLFGTESLFAQTPHKYFIAQLQITGAEHISNSEIINVFQTKQGDTLDEAKLSHDIESLVAKYADLGFAFANVTITKLQPVDNSHISVGIHITEGQLARLVACKVEGISETDTSVVRREFFISEHPVATRELLIGGSERLRQLGLFTNVSEPTLYKVNDSSVGVSLNVQESHTTAIDGVLGYNPAPISGASSYINGFLDLAFMNIGGSARQAAFRYQKLTPASSDLSFRYLEPWLLNIPIDGSFILNRHDEDSLYVATHLELSFALHSLSQVTISAGASYDGITPGTAHIVDASNIISGSVLFSMDQRDDPIAPQNGYKISLGARYGSKSITDSLGYASTVGIRTFIADAEGALSLGDKRLVGSISLSAHEVDSKVLELSDLFRIGGLASLRGYRDANFYVSRYAIARIEPRFMFSSRSYIGLFTDLGYLEQAEYQSVPFRKWSAVGYGVSFLFDTQIGYLQAAVALSRGTPLDGAVLHFGIKTSL
jgi:outer membrane protein assembly factor BamA